MYVDEAMDPENGKVTLMRPMAAPILTFCTSFVFNEEQYLQFYIRYIDSVHAKSLLSRCTSI
jgi:hypothetical protein